MPQLGIFDENVKGGKTGQNKPLPAIQETGFEKIHFEKDRYWSEE